MWQKCGIQLDILCPIFGEQEIAISLNGIITSYNDGVALPTQDNFLAILLKKLPHFSTSEQDIWIVLMSGCFLDPTPFELPAWMEDGVTDWWLDDNADNATLVSVIDEWHSRWTEEVLVPRAIPPSVVPTVAQYADGLQQLVDSFDDQTVLFKNMQREIYRSMEKVLDCNTRWTRLIFGPSARHEEEDLTNYLRTSKYRRY
jgi:hypothetical protein